MVLLSAQGRKFDQAVAREFAGLSELLLICGRYEGVDERVAEHLADEELSVGDFVLSGGELAAAMVIDAVGRLKEGVLGNRDSAIYESFSQDGCWIVRNTRGRRVSRLERPGSAAGRESRGNPAMAAEGGAEKTARQRPDLLGT